MRQVITETALVLLLGVLPAFASMNTGKELLFVGKVTSVDTQSHKLAVTSGDNSQMSFEFGDHTWVYGLSHGHHVADLAPGEDVIIQYTNTEKGLEAYMVRHPSDGPLMAADGRVVRFDAKHRDVVLEVPAGASTSDNGGNETFHIAKRASIQENDLLIRYHDLALNAGEQVTVYYTAKDGTRTIDALKCPTPMASGL